MEQDLVELYRAGTLIEAQLLKNRLAEEGINAFIGNDDSPFDGLTAARAEIVVMVSSNDRKRAVEIAAQFEAEDQGSPILAEDEDLDVDSGDTEDEQGGDDDD